MSAATVSRLDEVGAALLGAASHLLASEGPGALTVRRIAAEAGMSTMNVYSRFGSKDGVVEQLFLKGFELLAQGMSGVEESADPLADLAACGQSYRRFAIEHPTLYAVMFNRVVPDFVPSAPAQEYALGTLDLLAQRLQRAMDAGMLRPGDAHHAAAIVWSTCHGVVSLELAHAGLSHELAHNTLADIDWQQVFADATHAVVMGLAR